MHLSWVQQFLENPSQECAVLIYERHLKFSFPPYAVIAPIENDFILYTSTDQGPWRGVVRISANFMDSNEGKFNLVDNLVHNKKMLANNLGKDINSFSTIVQSRNDSTLFTYQ